jgi:hypothetical protein
MRGTWIYEVSHIPFIAGSGVLNEVTLRVTAAKPIKGEER